MIKEKSFKEKNEQNSFHGYSSCLFFFFDSTLLLETALRDFYSQKLNFV